MSNGELIFFLYPFGALFNPCDVFLHLFCVFLSGQNVVKLILNIKSEWDKDRNMLVLYFALVSQVIPAP
jgi:hypothetical protein